MGGYRNVYIEKWRKSLTLPAQLFLWPLSPYSSSHVHNSKGLRWHHAKCPPFLKFHFGWGSCHLPFEGPSQLLRAMQAAQRDCAGRPAEDTRASTCCKCCAAGNIAHTCFERSVAIAVRSWPSCLIIGHSVGGRRGERIHFIQEKCWTSQFLYKYFCTVVFFLQCWPSVDVCLHNLL